MIDVRSVRASRHAPHFGAHVLERALREAGFDYVYLGRELGGRPPDPAYYDSAGHVLYGRLAESDAFKAGIRRLVALGRQRPTAIMCAEEDPARCHRHLLIGRVLAGLRLELQHIRKNGRIEPPEPQPPLFQDAADWRSPGPIKRPAAQARTGRRGRPTAS